MTSPAVKLLMAASGGGGDPLPDVIAALSPAGYWKLDETSGTTANDSSGNGRNGTYGSGVTLSSVVGGDGVEYPNFTSGTNSVVTISDNADWSIGSGITLFALCKADVFSGESGSNRAIACRLDNVSGNRFEWAVTAINTVNSTTKLGAVKCNTDFSSYRIAQSSTSPLTTGQWNAVVVRFASDSVTVADDLWVDSSTELGQDTPTVVGTGTAANTTAELTIGDRGDAARQRWDGALAHVAIFNYELSDTEIGDLLAAAVNDGWI